MSTDAEEGSESGDEVDVGDGNLMQTLAGLLLLEALIKQPDTTDEQTFINSVSQGNTADVEKMLMRCPQFVSKISKVKTILYNLLNSLSSVS